MFSPLYADVYKDQLRSKYLDDSVMSMKTKYGTQSPLVPDLPGQTKLRNSIFVIDTKTGERSQYTYGETEVAHVNRNKLVNPNRLHLIDYKVNDFDGILKWSDLAKRSDVKKIIVDFILTMING